MRKNTHNKNLYFCSNNKYLTYNLKSMKLKKNLLTLLIGTLISISAIAQSKSELRAEKLTIKSIEKIETETKLTEDEKVKYTEIQKEKLLNHFKIANEFRKSDPDKFKEKVKENGHLYVKNLLETFGNRRGREILNASR